VRVALHAPTAYVEDPKTRRSEGGIEAEFERKLLSPDRALGGTALCAVTVR
jgi:hypothetical protein